jgi:hypothetical protein
MTSVKSFLLSTLFAFHTVAAELSLKEFEKKLALFPTKIDPTTASTKPNAYAALFRKENSNVNFTAVPFYNGICYDMNANPKQILQKIVFGDLHQFLKCIVQQPSFK